MCIRRLEDVQDVKAAMEYYLMHYTCVFITLLGKDLYKPAFPTDSLKNLVFCLSRLCIFCLLCFKFDANFIDLNHFRN